MLNLLIVTPMQQELDFFSQACTQRGLHAQDAVIGRLPVVQFRELNITLARGGTGKAQFALQTQHLLDSCTDWSLVVCAGGAGGLVNELEIGDVVVATTTVEHDYNNKFNQRPLPRFEGAQAAILDLRSASLSAGSFKVHFGPVASGDEDVIEAGRKSVLHQLTEALVVSWEGAGGARACNFSNVPFVEIRGVTDKADQDAPSDFYKNLEVAMNNVATLITSWIRQLE
jgi:adenosylhomocysteine nucleosidase